MAGVRRAGCGVGTRSRLAGTGLDFCTWWGCYWSVFNLVRLFSNGSMNRHLKRAKLKAGRPAKK